MKKLILAYTIGGLIFSSLSVFGQLKNTNELSGSPNTITTAVPFLLIAPDARSGGMGEVGVATDPDANSIHWNPSKMAFLKEQGGVSLSYTPWLRQLVNDISLTYLSGYYKISDKQAISASLLYFSLGSITFTDINGTTQGDYNPNEFAIDMAFSQKLAENTAMGIALRYIRSDLNIQSASGEGHAGNAVGADISFYSRKELTVFKKDAVLAYGADISNVGSKMSYTTSGERDFIPSNMRIGSTLTTNIDKYNSFAVSLDLNKLLVPTPNPARVATEPNYLSNISVPSGIFNSFSDAPGGGKEELQEIIWNMGLEYWYDKQFAVRAGYFHESVNKGGRQYLTIGAGLRYNVFGLDLAYIIPTSTQKSPLENTLRLGLLFNFDNSKKRNEPAQ